MVCGARSGGQRHGRILESYRQWSPSAYAAALAKFKTPTLVIAGEQDLSRALYGQDLLSFSRRFSARECRPS